MRKAILLFLMAFSALAHSQTQTKDKSAKTEEKALVKALTPDKSKQAVPDKTKPIAVRDTVKTSTIPVVIEPEIVFNDTVIAFNGKFRPFKNNVHASYYHNKFNGKRTASGKRFDNKKYTAAHRKLPFGTILKITNEENGKSVLVEVTDRGPFSRGREIDLTRKAFMEIATNKNSGGMKVRIEIANQ